MDLGKVVGQLQAGWLNDNIIDYYLGLITERAVANGVKVACHLCCFHAKLKMDTGKYNYSAVSRWAKRRKFGGKDLLGMEYIFIPINLNESHWTLGVMNIKDKRFEYYDSMRDTLRQYFEDETGTKPTNWIDWGMGDKGPRQENYSDCGLFLLKTAEVIARGANLDFDHHDINIFRKWVTLEVYDGQLKHV
ncbi:hypothetical protein EDC01DRAFT_614610 [Geopyxis carbonaria]|nr:hypothetical protein EDC01DRAFT_614610 [Geopyxis carbonaria]